MGIYGMMRTGVSGMHAQSNRLSGIADNVANSSTVGYKRTDTQFSTLVLPSTPNSYQSGSVNTHVRHDITSQGTARSTMRAGDVMINGNGFYRVADANGTEFMTRAGSFMRDGEGYIQNASGFYLLDPEGNRIRIKGGPTELYPGEVTKNIDMAMNLNAGAEVISRDTVDFDPDKSSSYSMKKSVDIYDQQGTKITLNMYYTKVAAGDASATPPTEDTWEIQFEGVKNNEKVEIDGGPVTLTFNEKGALTSPEGTSKLTVPGANGVDFEVTLNYHKEQVEPINSIIPLTTQQGDTYAFEFGVDGVEPGIYESFDIGKNGEIVVTYSNGKSRQVATVGMATVTSPDNLKVVSGTVFQYTVEAGSIMYGSPGDGTFGTLSSGTLEESQADIATELTDMIESQRNYTANSKVFQAGSDLMEVITNLR